MAALGALGILVAGVLLIALAILAIFMPWYVYKIAHYSELTYELLKRQERSGATTGAGLRDG